MSLGMELGIGPGDFELDGYPAPLPKRGQSPQIFGPCLLWPNSWMNEAGTWHGGRPRPRRLCVRWRPYSPSPIFGSFLLWPNGWMDQDGTWHGARHRPKRLFVTWGPSCPLPKRGAESPKFVLSLLVYSSSSSTALCILFLEKSLIVLSLFQYKY